MTPRSDRDIRVVLIGFGLGGASFHAPLIAATPGMMLAAIVTANPARQTQAARDYPGAAVLASADDVWRDAANYDLAVISTANRSHVPLGLAALAAGLAVVMDKPFAPDVAGARQMIQAAKAKGLALSAYHNRRWDSECLTLRGLLERGALGRVLRFESRLERWRPLPKGGWRESGAPEDAGGLLYDIGSHLIDQALYLFGPVAEVYAELDCRRAGMETDDDVFLALTHMSGVRSHLWTSLLAAEPGPRMRVLGDKASFVKRDADLQEARLREGGRPSSMMGSLGWGAEPPENWGILSDGVTRQAVPSVPGAYQDFYAGMVAALKHGAPVPVDPKDAVAGLTIIEAARKSAASKNVVCLV